MFVGADDGEEDEEESASSSGMMFAVPAMVLYLVH